MKKIVVLLFLLVVGFSCKKEETCPPPEVSVDPNASLKEGLVAYYPFNGNVNDVSGNNLNGSIVGNVTFSENRYFEANKCIQLDGNNSYVKVADNVKLQIKQKMSIYLEFMPEDLEISTLIGKRSIGTGEQAWQIATNYQSPVVFQLIKAGKCSANNLVSDWSYTYSNPAIEVKKDCWNHLVAIFDGVSQKIYINGKLASNVAVNFAEMAGCPSEMRFGYWWTGDPLPFMGKLDEIRIYNRALTISEVDKLIKLD